MFWTSMRRDKYSKTKQKRQWTENALKEILIDDICIQITHKKHY